MGSRDLYLYPSGRIAVLTTELMGREGLDRLERTKDLDELISTIGSTHLRNLTPHLRDEVGGEKAFADEMRAIIEFIRDLSPDPRIPDMLSLGEKYLNLKIYAKTEAGLVAPSKLEKETMDDPVVTEAIEAYSKTDDLGVIDRVIEKRWLEELSELAAGESYLERIVQFIKELYDARCRVFFKYLDRKQISDELGIGVSHRFDELFLIPPDEVDSRIAAIFLDELELSRYEPYGVDVLALYAWRRVTELRSTRAVWLKKLLEVGV